MQRIEIVQVRLFDVNDENLVVTLQPGPFPEEESVWTAVTGREDTEAEIAKIAEQQKMKVDDVPAEIAKYGMTPEQRLHWSREQVFIALGNAVNGAYSLGLGACPMTAFQADEFARILELPPTVVPTVLLSVGYSAEDGSPKLRHPVSEIVL